MHSHDYDFFRIEGKLPVYIRLEAKLERIGRLTAPKPSFLKRLIYGNHASTNHWVGFSFKNKVLKEAGWDVNKDGAYINNPDKAAKVMLRIGKILGQTKQPDDILKLASKFNC